MASHGAIGKLRSGELVDALVLHVIREETCVVDSSCGRARHGAVGDGDDEMPFVLTKEVPMYLREMKTVVDQAGNSGILLHVHDYVIKEGVLLVSSCTVKRDGRLVRKAQRALMAERFREMRAARAARALPLLALLELIFRKRAKGISFWSTTRAVCKLAQCVTGVRARVLSFLTGDMYKCLHPKRGPRVTPMVGPVSW